MSDISTVKTEFLKSGWVKVKNVFSAQEIDEIVLLVKALSDKQILNTENPMLIDQSKEGEQVSRKLAEPFFLHPQFRQFMFCQRIKNLIDPVIGTGAKLLFDHIFMKPAFCGAEKLWHQDGFYFDITPIDQGISVWVALEDADEGNGCLQYIPGSHQLGLQSHHQPNNNPALAQITNDCIDVEKMVFVPAQRGDVILHHFHSIHSSGPNRSHDSRIAYASHWLGKGSTGAGASWFKSYPLRAEYQRLIKDELLS